ncbi:MAG: Uma2 family endonuclease [Spirochaetaceae bacterium]|nr:Uma2 family endonuclease [Spirochaetaceae bacterium]
MKSMADPARSLDERFTYGDYRKWPEGERWELIEGVPYSMSPAPNWRHQELLGRLHLEIGQFLRGKTCKVAISPFDILLPKGDEGDEAVDTVLEPDLMVFCDRSKIGETRARGAPDFTIEILSPRTARRDFGLKWELYERHGVREYWIVDPEGRRVHAWRLEQDGRFGAEIIYESGSKAPVAVLDGLVIDVDALFAE